MVVGRAQRPAHHHLLAVIIAVAVAFSWIAAAASPASAHDQLLSTSPASGSISPTAPTELVLTFSQAPMSGTVKVIATDHLGEAISLPEPTVNRGVVKVGWPGGEPGGTYRVAWRVTSSDGHPISGAWDFTYGLASPQPVADPSAAQANSQNAASEAPWFAIGAGLVIVLVIVGAWLLIRRRKTLEQ